MGNTTHAKHMLPRWGYRLHVGVTLVVTLRREHQFLPKVLDCVRTCLKKKNPTQKLMFMLNHWSSKILT